MVQEAGGGQLIGTVLSYLVMGFNLLNNFHMRSSAISCRTSLNWQQLSKFPILEEIWPADAINEKAVSTSRSGSVTHSALPQLACWCSGSRYTYTPIPDRTP